MVPVRNDVAKREQLRGLGKELMHLDTQNAQITRGVDFGARFGSALREADANLYDSLKPFNDTDLLEAHGEEILDAFIGLSSEDTWRSCLTWYLHIVSLAGRADLYFTLFTLHENLLSRLPTLLTCAVRGGSMEIMESLLEIESVTQLVREYDWNGEVSPFHWAAMLGHRSIVAALIDAGAPLELKHMLLGTVLSSAVENGHVEVVLDLLRAGADVNCINDRGFYNFTFPDYTPLCIASSRNSKTIVDILLAAGAQFGTERATVLPLHLAAEQGCLQPLNSLLAAGASIDLVNSDGRSALHMACLHTHPEKLRNRGWNSRATSRTFPAYSEGGRSLERLLLGGAQVDLPDADGRSALHLACMHSHERAVKLLLQHGASLNLLCHKDHSPRDVVALEALNKRGFRLGHRSPSTLDDEETSRADRIYAMLSGAGAWRRRGWLIMMRSRCQATVHPGNQAMSSSPPPPPPPVVVRSLVQAASPHATENERYPDELDRVLSADRVVSLINSSTRLAKGFFYGLGGAEGGVTTPDANGEYCSIQTRGKSSWNEAVVLLVLCPDESGVFREVVGFI